MPYGKVLEVMIGLNDNDEVFVNISDDESGDRTYDLFPYSPDEHLEFDSVVGNRLYDYLEDLMNAKGGR